MTISMDNSNTVIQHKRNIITSGPVLYGTGFIILFYIVFIIWALMQSGSAIKEQEARLDTKTIAIERLNGAFSSAGQSTLTKSTPTAKGNSSLSKYDIHRIEKYNLETLPNGMVISPIESLHKIMEDGVIPIIRDDGLTAFNGYKAPFNKQLIDAPIISIAIVNLGLSESATESAIRNMPPEVSLIISPYTKAPDFWINEARANGHEVWFSLPTEPDNYPLNDPGPHTLLVNGTEQDNLRKVNWLMGRGKGYVGFVTEPNSVFMKAPQDMRTAINEIYTHGLGFIDGSETPSLIPQSIAHGLDAAYGTIDIWIDTVPTSADIQKLLHNLEIRAKERGMASGVINTYPVSYKEIQDWLESLKTKGFVLAPLSAQIKQKE